MQKVDNNFMNDVMASLDKMSIKELEKEKSGYYNENRYEIINIKYNEKLNHLLWGIVDKYENTSPDGDMCRGWRPNISKISLQYYVYLNYDGSEDSYYYDLSRQESITICQLVQIKYNTSLNIRISNIEIDDKIYLSICQHVTNKRHPNWQGTRLFQYEVNKIKERTQHYGTN